MARKNLLAPIMNTNHNKTNNRQVFIGLAHVLANKTTVDVLKGSKGAYVNILCLALNETEFLEEAMKVLNSIGLNLIDVEDIETLSERIKRHEVEDNLLGLAKQISEERKVMLGPFHTYD